MLNTFRPVSGFGPRSFAPRRISLSVMHPASKPQVRPSPNSLASLSGAFKWGRRVDLGIFGKTVSPQPSSPDFNDITHPKKRPYEQMGSALFAGGMVAASVFDPTLANSLMVLGGDAKGHVSTALTTLSNLWVNLRGGNCVWEVWVDNEHREAFYDGIRGAVFNYLETNRSRLHPKLIDPNRLVDYVQARCAAGVLKESAIGEYLRTLEAFYERIQFKETGFPHSFNFDWDSGKVVISLLPNGNICVEPRYFSEYSRKQWAAITGIFQTFGSVVEGIEELEFGDEAAVGMVGASWAGHCLSTLDARLVVKGIENLPPSSRGFLIDVTHTGGSISEGPPLLLAAQMLGMNFRAVARKNVPVLGLFLQLADGTRSIMIDREKPRQARQKIKADSEKQALTGATARHTFVFGSGTRSEREEDEKGNLVHSRLHPHKTQVVFMSLISGQPIVPTVVNGAGIIDPKGTWGWVVKGQTIEVIFGKPIDPKPILAKHREALLGLIKPGAYRLTEKISSGKKKGKYETKLMSWPESFTEDDWQQVLKEVLYSYHVEGVEIIPLDEKAQNKFKQRTGLEWETVLETVSYGVFKLIQPDFYGPILQFWKDNYKGPIAQEDEQWVG